MSSSAVSEYRLAPSANGLGRVNRFQSTTSNPTHARLIDLSNATHERLFTARPVHTIVLLGSTTTNADVNLPAPETQ